MLDARPLPDHLGVGFTMKTPLKKDPSSYRYEQVGRYHNYYFTSQKFDWPQLPIPQPVIVDAFSPNVNKHLHVGHLRNLALAKGYTQIFEGTGSRFVALLGYSLGELAGAVDALNRWLDFVGYHPEVYRDTEIAHQIKLDTFPGELEYQGCEVWQGLKSPVVIRRSDGTTTYACHDLAFAKLVTPTHYLTGSEQREHFENLGLGKKHLPMGLVLDPKTGKKMKSRDGTALSANEAMQLVVGRLDTTPEPKKLAWNVLAWNFLHVGRSKDVKFNIDGWTTPDSPGLYITYTYARLASIFKDTIPEEVVVDEKDLKLLGFCQYLTYAKYCSQVTMDLAPVAEFAHDLARKVGALYHEERIDGGRLSFRWAVYQAMKTIETSMKLLGMSPLERV